MNGPLSAIPVFEVASALARIDGDAGMYSYFLTVFRDKNAGCVGKIRVALRHGDTVGARILVHSLKGGSATVGAVRLAAAAAWLEKSLEELVADDRLLVIVEDEWQRTMRSLIVLLESPLQWPLAVFER